MTQRTGLVPSSTTVAAIAVLAFTVGWTPLAEADITRIVIARVESPTFEGVSFGAVGQYEKLVGRAFGEVDPHDPRNAVIVDIALAPRNARGMVEYSTDIYILRPVDPDRGNHRLFFEVNNRGNVFSFGRMNDAGTGGNDPTTAADAGNGFLMRQGYTVVSSGWDVTVAPGGGRQTITVPVAKNRDGSSIVGPALEEFAFDNATTMTGSLTYPTATLDKSQASLTRACALHRHARADPGHRLGICERPDDQAVTLGHTIRAEQAVRVHVSREGSECRGPGVRGHP